MSVSSFMGYLKGKSALMMFDFVKISCHIFFKDFVSYAASFRES